MSNSYEALTSFSIHPDVLLSVLDDATALVDKRGRVRATNARMEQLFTSDDTARRLPLTQEDGRWRLGPSGRLDERLRDVVTGIQDVIAGARERYEVDLGMDGGYLLAIACSIDNGRGALVRIRLRTVEALRREMAWQESQATLMELIRQLSTPLLPIADGVLVAPLVGQMDETRGAHFIEVLLEGIQRHSANAVLIDITGVPSIDASVAEQLLRAARAARLLGTRTALVGISPSVARTMVGLGFEATDFEMYADLRAAMHAAQRGRHMERPKRS